MELQFLYLLVVDVWSLWCTVAAFVCNTDVSLSLQTNDPWLEDSQQLGAGQ